MQLEPDGCCLEHSWLIREIDHGQAIRDHPDVISKHEDFDAVPLTDVFGLRLESSLMSGGKNSVATIGIPNSPIIAEHQQWGLEAKGISLVGEFFPEHGDGGMGCGEGRVPRLFDFEQESEIAVRFLGPKIGARRDLVGVCPPESARRPRTNTDSFAPPIQ